MSQLKRQSSLTRAQPPKPRLSKPGTFVGPDGLAHFEAGRSWTMVPVTSVRTSNVNVVAVVVCYVIACGMPLAPLPMYIQQAIEGWFVPFLLARLSVI